MEYSIRPIGRTCTATGEELTPGTWCRSALIARNGQFQRLDFRLDAWTAEPEGTIGHWRTLVPEKAKPNPRRRRLEADELLAEFERLEEAGHAQLRRLRYVLALLLLRKRRLELDGTRRDGDEEYLIVFGTKGEGPFEVRDEHLEPDQIAQLEAELQASMTAAAEGESD